MLLVPIIGILIGMAFLAWAVSVWRRGEATRRWPSVQGEISGAQVIEERQRPSDPHISYRSCVTYRYAVRGHTYDGSRISVGGGETSKSQNAALDKVRKYRPGQKVTVFHDPAAPEHAALEVGAPYTVVFLLLFIAAMCIGISAVLLAGPR